MESFILAAGFVTPWFFGAGFLLASVPIIIHILNRRRFKTVNWDASGAPSGVYYYRLRAGGFGELKKMILLR